MKYFGTDGIRGKLNSEYICETFYRILAFALENFAKHKNNKQNLKIVIGHDTRGSAIYLKNALLSGFTDAVDVLDCGVIPTPAVSLNTIHEHADFGISITASHNPYTYNGIKFFNSHGEKFSVNDEELFEKFIYYDETHTQIKSTFCSAKNFHKQAIENYKNFIKKAADGLNLLGIKILLDCANGATCETTPDVLRSLGAEVITINNTPNGKNINLNCGSEHADLLIPSKYSCDIAIAHDGDGDRAVFIDENNKKIDGDQLLGILAKYYANNIVVVTIQSNLGLDKYIQSINKTTIRSDVGDKNVAYKMKESGAIFGGENSGHIIFQEILSTGDGLLSAIKLLAIIPASNKNLSNLANEIQLFNQATCNINIAKKISFDTIQSFLEELKALEAKLGSDGRILTRYSGTEPKLRLLVEAKTQEQAEQTLSELRKIITNHLNNFII